MINKNITIFSFDNIINIIYSLYPNGCGCGIVGYNNGNGYGNGNIFFNGYGNSNGNKIKKLNEYFNEDGCSINYKENGNGFGNIYINNIIYYDIQGYNKI